MIPLLVMENFSEGLIPDISILQKTPIRGPPTLRCLTIRCHIDVTVRAGARIPTGKAQISIYNIFNKALKGLNIRIALTIFPPIWENGSEKFNKFFWGDSNIFPLIVVNEHWVHIKTLTHCKITKKKENVQ